VLGNQDKQRKVHLKILQLGKIKENFGIRDVERNKCHEAFRHTVKFAKDVKSTLDC